MDIASMYMDELKEYMTSRGEPAFRAKQVFEWLHKKQAQSAEEMTNLPKQLREKLEQDMLTVREELRQTSKEDGTVKFLYRLHDGNLIETVWMPHDYGISVCVSSQAGCRMGCRFCASTIGGLIRNLSASEILGQIYASMRAMGKRVDNVVVMGTGEPFDNYDNLIRFIRLLTAPEGYNLSARSITVSTCGIVEKIYAFAQEGLPVTLALSLHATTDEERKALMPVAHTYSLSETLDACRAYFEKTGRRVSYEYSLVRGQNDSEAHAERLSKLLAGQNCHVNLIPVNPIAERDFRASEPGSIQKFKFILEKNSINGTIRRSVGSDIDAACGQLRRKAATGSLDQGSKERGGTK